MIERFVAFWDSRETPEPLAWLRIAMPLVVLTDLLHARWLGIHRVMWSPIGEGGWSVTAASADEIPMIMQVFGATTEVATGTFWATCLACMLLASGTFSRTSALALVLLWAQLEDMLPVADRAIDRLYRNLLLVLAFSGAGRAWSVDAWLSTGSLRGSGDVVGGWARRLFILQVTWMYLDAGLEKTAASRELRRAPLPSTRPPSTALASVAVFASMPHPDPPFDPSLHDAEQNIQALVVDPTAAASFTNVYRARLHF